MQHNWQAARDYYIQAGWGGVSMMDVATRYGIPYQSVRRRAGREKWRLWREWQSIDPDCESLEDYIAHYK